ncbi:DUF1778 domain-containing protein [Pseudoduganella sp. LjRoot289]|uniref:type II toxin-antitoxin system TacA family antitoxin n=1 Tax=Pseudoduganella sp. LjRoot289 TaxID=3342314 RepID=UPI003ECEA9A7
MLIDTTAVRLDAAISPELHALLKMAAELQGRSIDEFVVAALDSAARQTIALTDTLQLSARDQESLARALIDPPPLTQAMKRAIQTHRKLIRSE